MSAIIADMILIDDDDKDNQQQQVITNNFKVLSYETNQVWKSIIDIYSTVRVIGYQASTSTYQTGKSLYKYYLSTLMPLKVLPENQITSLYNEVKQVYHKYRFIQQSDQLVFKFLFAYLSLCMYAILRKKSDNMKQFLTDANTMFTQLVDNDLPLVIHALPVYNRLMALSYHSRALTHSFQDSYDEELADDLKVIELEPDFSSTYYNIGLLYSQDKYPLKNPTKAIEFFSKCLEFSPEKKEAIMGIVTAYTDMKQYDKGIEYCNKALTIDKKFGQAIHNLGILYYFKSEYDKALEYYTKSLEYFNSDGAVHYNISLIYQIQSKVVLAAEKLAVANMCQQENKSWQIAKDSLMNRLHNSCADSLMNRPSLDESMDIEEDNALFN
jgi:tetratricopeptide (TPR) repeat protein